MNLYNIWVSLSEMSDTKYLLFHDIQFFVDVPVYIYRYVLFPIELAEIL